MLKILIADDHAILRMGLKQLIVDECAPLGPFVFGEAQNGQEVLDLAHQERWGLILLDISMPGRDGLEVLNELHHHDPALPVLMLSVYPEDQYALRSIQLGASGYLTKDAAPEELARAIQKIANGGKYVSPTLADLFVLEGEKPRPGPSTLSHREHQIFRLIASGKTVTEIAWELALSVKTVSTYRIHVLEKMGMKNNAELTHYAIHSHLVD